MAEAMAELGGVAHLRNLVRLTSMPEIRACVADGSLVRVDRYRFRTRDVDKAFRRAVELRGMVSHLSAAAHYGWEMPFAPSLPWITVPRNRQVRGARRAIVVWADLSEESGFVTSPMRTVIDCARRCEFAVALCIADSAMRKGDVDAESLVKAAAQVRGKGAAQARRVAREASGLAANAFESTLRGLAKDTGLDAEPQVAIVLGDVTVHPDVVDTERRIVLEADSWEFHSTKDAFQRDCWRYTSLVVRGWTVLRFTWWQVMHEPDWVTECLEAVRDEADAGSRGGANAA